MKHLKYVVFVVFIVTGQILAAQTDSTVSDVFAWDASYIGDLGQNFDGGIKKGNTLMGLLSLGASLRTDRLWKGGELYGQVMSSHGKGLSANYIGDLQYVSSIENGNYWIFVEKFYYRQHFRWGWLTIGLQDLNQDFLVNDGGCHFVNSSFGTPSTFPLNFPAPIYPKTTLAVSGMYSLSDEWTIKLAVFDGDCGTLERDKINMRWEVPGKNELLWIGELSYVPMERIQIKVGGIYHTGNFPEIEDSSKVYKGVFGTYTLVDWSIIQRPHKRISSFAMVSYHPSKGNYNPLYLGGGLVIQGYIFNRAEDHLGLGFAYARFYDHSYECDIECNYCIGINQHISLMPSFHYVLHPGGGMADLRNATAGILRIILTK